MASVIDILRAKGSLVHTVAPDAMVFEAVEKMVLHNIGALLVTDENKLQGIITERDYLKRLAVQGRSSKSTPVSEIMTRDLATVSPDTDVDKCMELMTGRRIRHLPVIDGTQLVGLVSIGDLVKCKLRDQDAHIQYLTDYIQGAPTASYLGST